MIDQDIHCPEMTDLAEGESVQLGTAEECIGCPLFDHCNAKFGLPE